MGTPSAQRPPGRDEDLARRLDEPDGEAPWEPVITRPDPMTAEEWQARLDCEADDGLDPEMFQDEDEFWRPGEEDLAGAARAADEPVAADEPDPAGVARALAAQAAAAAAKRRGPGQPGSARPLAGESSGRAASGRAASFGAGLELDIMAACPDLAVLADRAAGPGDTYAGASDDELIGMVCAWDRLESHMAARKLAAIAAFSRRRPLVKTPASGRPGGSAEEDFAADELAHVLAESRRKADGLLTTAGRLEGYLPGTRAALLDGVITAAKAQIIVTATVLLSSKQARAAENRVLGRAGRLTPGGLRDAIARAVKEIAPKKAREQREAAAKTARVERWGEPSGNGALAGRELPPAAMLAADQRITAWARQLKAAGHEGDMDALRARAYLDLLTGTDSRPGQDAKAAGPVPAGFTGQVNLTIPVTTALDLAGRPGDLSGFGPVDPWLARDLARAAAASPQTTWCVTFTDADGHAVAHGCARPAPKNHTSRRKRSRTRFSFTRTTRAGPPGGHGTWLLRVPGNGPDLIVEIEPITTENCDHRHQASGHEPGIKLRHLARIRHATCTSPVCRRPAATCDYEHNTPYEAGGKTCLCNGGPKCRHDHRVKQHPRWKVDQLPDGTFRWTTPSGRTYDTEPTRYPI
ncbi:MAG: hypothetical protein ABSB59_21495 [Streptosporangiaceae bacterium]|jgi:hypothetical protein